MKILLIGKTGQLGTSILANNNDTHEIHAPGRDLLDILKPETVSRAIQSFGPDVIINTAAFHNVQQCQSDPGTAYEMNFIAVRNIAIEARRAGAVFVTLSTDYVFNGKNDSPYTESDIADPLQVYGKSKLAGELAAMAHYPEKTFVIRTCGLYGLEGAQSKGGNFVDKRLKDAEKSNSMSMGIDQTVTPTFTDDLAMAILRLLEIDEASPGIYHLVSEDHCTWYDFTKAIFKISGVEMQVTPVDRKGIDGNTVKPLFSVLANQKAKNLGIVLPHWQDALQKYIELKYHRKPENK